MVLEALHYPPQDFSSPLKLVDSGPCGQPGFGRDASGGMLSTPHQQAGRYCHTVLAVCKKVNRGLTVIYPSSDLFDLLSNELAEARLACVGFLPGDCGGDVAAHCDVGVSE